MQSICADKHFAVIANEQDLYINKEKHSMNEVVCTQYQLKK